MNTVKKLSSLKAAYQRDRISDREAQVVQIIRAYRRGVKLSDIGRALGMSSSTSIYQQVGLWALRHAKIPGDGK